MTAAARDAATRACGSPVLTCRFAFAYPDGPAPYYTVMAAGWRGEETDQWDAIKAAASEAMLQAGGTITYHQPLAAITGLGMTSSAPNRSRRPGQSTSLICGAITFLTSRCSS